MCVADAEDRRSDCRHPLAAGLGEAVPILLYHVIGNRPAGGIHVLAPPPSGLDDYSGG